MTKSRRKLLITMLVAMLVILTAVAVVTLAFASTQQNISTTLNISYYATRDVYAEITGGVYSNNVKTQNIDFTIDGDTVNGDLGLKDIDIDSTSSDKSVYIEFKIRNTQPNEEDGEFYINPVINTSTSKNIKTTRYVSFTDDLNYEEFTENNVLLQQDKIAYIRLKFEVENIAYNASLQGNLTLNFYSVEEKPTTAHTSTIAGVGMYPQKYVGNTLNETLKSATLSATGKTYTTDVAGEETTLTVYDYAGMQVAKLDSSYPYGSDYKFSTGDTVSSSATYFFYVQPIKVSAMEGREVNGETKTIWLTKDIIFSQMFNTYAEGNSAWEISPLRTFLNGTFLTESGINATEISIENGTASGSYTEQANTNDTLWLPSAKEIGENGWYTTNELRKKKPTDMTLATCAYYYSDYNAGYYWTRSAYDSSLIYNVYDDGRVQKSAYGELYNLTFSTFCGISFAFAM